MDIQVKLPVMKLFPLLILVLFIGPTVGSAIDACCAATSDQHVDRVVENECGGDVHFESGTADCCDENRCDECTFCHLLTFVPLFPETSRDDLAMSRPALLPPEIYDEIVAPVLTPPPTL